MTNKDDTWCDPGTGNPPAEYGGSERYARRGGSGGDAPDMEYGSNPEAEDYYEPYDPGEVTDTSQLHYLPKDVALRDMIYQALVEEGPLDSWHFDAQVDDNGVVTLTGTVETERQKQLAEQAARNLPGTTEVRNELRVTGRTEAHAGGTSPAAQPASTTEEVGLSPGETVRITPKG